MLASCLPVLRLEGEPFQQGLAHGRQVAEYVHHNWKLYLRRFLAEAGLTEAEVLRRAALWHERILCEHPDYAATMAGIAAGSGLTEHAVVALNVRFELLYSAFAEQGQSAPECTAAVLLPERTQAGRTLLIENWDWFPDISLVWLHEARNGVELLAVTEAGVAGGKIGINSAGLGMAVTGLVSQLDRWDGEGVPFHVRCHRILGATDLGTVARVVEDDAAPCSSSFLVTVDDKALCLERAPSSTAYLRPNNGVLVHANHFTADDELSVLQPLGDERLSTFHRHSRLSALLRPRTTWDASALQGPLRDHDGYPDAVCRHPVPEMPPDRRYATALSVVLEPQEGRLTYTSGPPCRGSFRELRLPKGLHLHGARPEA